MKKIIVILCVAVLFVCAGTSCRQTTSKFNAEKFNNEDITYVKDERTGLCFALVASRSTDAAGQSGIGMSCVPCEEVKDFIK